jgi:hypothetical protein
MATHKSTTNTAMALRIERVLLLISDEKIWYAT